MDKYINEDGRQGEKRTSIDADGNKVIEIFLEPAIEKYMAQRIVEKSRPVVVSRETVYLDDSGQVIERKLEAEAAPNVQVVEHLALAADRPQDAQESVSRDELRLLLLELVQARKEAPSALPVVSAYSLPSASYSLPIARAVEKPTTTTWLLLGLMVVAVVGFVVWIY